MADFTSTGYQANVGRTSGSGVTYNVGGRSFDADSPEGRNFLKTRLTSGVKQAQSQIAAQENLAAAEVEADAQEYEGTQNREAGNRAFQFAMSQAGGRRQPGGGLARGGYGRRGLTLNAATGGLAAANAAARKKAQTGLAKARVAADPGVQRLQAGISQSNSMLRAV